MNIFGVQDTIDREKYIIVRYDMTSTISLRDAAWNLAIGQSVGNPSVRSVWETDELFENHACLILQPEEELSKVKSGLVEVAFPVVNTDFDTDGVSHFLCQIMGGQLDIDTIVGCVVLNIEFPECVKKKFRGPKFGIQGIRKFTKVYDRPLVGAIIKPKTGISPQVLLEMTKELVEGGVNFIKEDEILASPAFCPLEERVPLISNYLKGRGVIYAFSINADPAYILDRAKKVNELGGNAIHVNFWSGLGVYKSIRDLDIPLFIHFQKSGDKILTNKSHAFHISWSVICQLATMMGVDFIHAGMWGGYASDDEKELHQVLDILQKGGTMPALSCGMHPGLVQAIAQKFGNDFLANTGGAIHGHPDGTLAGAKAMVQAATGNTEGPEYQKAIAKWGLVK